MSFQEAAKKILNSAPQFNFRVERNNKIIGKMQGLPIENTNYIHVITSNIDIEIEDCLINKLNQKFTVIKTEIIDKVLTLSGLNSFRSNRCYSTRQ